MAPTATAPTPEEIRATLRENVTEGDARQLHDAIMSYDAPLNCPLHDAMESAKDVYGEDTDPRTMDGVWADLRRSEAMRLGQLLEDARQRAFERCEQAIFDELTAAALQFAQEYPDAPRGRPMVPSAKATA